MSLTETHAVVLASEVEPMLEENELPVAAPWFGVFALVVFLLLLGVTYSFRTVAQRQ
ncbi:MAG: hypothetical protein ACFCUP_05440 [Actinomycetales bacterium]